MANIKQTDLLEFIVKQFNDNSFGIPYRMGTFDGSNENGITIYAPPMSNDGFFDKTAVFNEETYQTQETSFVVMSAQMSNGDYIALPDTQLVNYSMSLSFLVNIDSPVSEPIRMAIEEVRDRLIGYIDTLEISEVDLDNENGSRIEEYLKIVTNSSGIDFGQIIEIRGRRYLEYSMTVNMSVSKDVEFGNQFEWQIAFNTKSWQYLGLNISIAYAFNLDQTTHRIPQVNLFPNASLSSENTVMRVGIREDDETHHYYYKAVFVYETVIPLIASFGTNQELESLQTLNSLNPTELDKAKEIHSYVKMRGFSHTFTFLFKRDVSIIKSLFKETFAKLEKPNQYRIKMLFKYLDESGDWQYDNDISWDRGVVVGDAIPSDIVYGTPTTFTIGFHPSAKVEVD